MAVTTSGRSGRTTSRWAVGTREVVNMGIGAALYGVLGWATSFLKIPGPFNSTVRPAIVIPMFFGAIFGPWVGFFTGLVGNIIIDLVSGFGFSWNWSLANGLLGLISGLAFARASGIELPKLPSILTWAIIGTLVSFLFASVLDIWVYTTDPALVPLQYFQVIVPNVISAVVLLPILYVAYRQVQERSGR